MRSVWDGKVQAVWPVTVVSDSPEALVLFLAAGTKYKIRHFSGDMQGRMPIGEWQLVNREWTRDMIRIMLPGDNHAYLGFWDQRHRFERWYINLEREYERTSIGIDFVDLFLDVVIDPDTKEWYWKDESELSCAVSLGLVSQQEANLIRAEGCAALWRFTAGAPPFSRGWAYWRPDPDWPIPSLDTEWNS
ncbi:MAG: DUF402 domain-containing protein [Chloroflexota bacterium]|nr:DUF402 domain-containing protein [Chloroflexota bacterium]